MFGCKKGLLIIRINKEHIATEVMRIKMNLIRGIFKVNENSYIISRSKKDWDHYAPNKIYPQIITVISVPRVH